MNKSYNNMDQIASKMFEHFTNTDVLLSKPNRKMLAYSIISMATSESIVTADLANTIKSQSFSSNTDSIQKRFWRFFNNKNINPYEIYNTIIIDVIKIIKKIKKTNHNKLVITIDHMYTKNNFVTFMATLRIDKQGIPIYFRTERTLSNCHMEIQKNSRKPLFSQKFITDSIDEIIKLFENIDSKITFLADRWFCNLSVLKHINDKGHFYAIRAKANSSIKIFLYDENWS